MMSEMFSAYLEHDSIFGYMDFGQFRKAWKQFQKLKTERETIRFDLERKAAISGRRAPFKLLVVGE